jgi:hypothetical protein
MLFHTALNPVTLTAIRLADSRDREEEKPVGGATFVRSPQGARPGMEREARCESSD